MGRRRVFDLLLLAVLIVESIGTTTNAGPLKAFAHDNSGNLTAVVDVTSDVMNCGAIGRRCTAGQVCCSGACCGGLCMAGGACCVPKTCAAWQACGQLDDGCGSTIGCGASAGGGPGCAANEVCAASTCFERRSTDVGYVARADNLSNQLVVVAGNRWDMEVKGQFVSSRGSYAAAMQFIPKSPSPVNWNIDRGLASSPQYTLECACPSDPNADPNELSCWCDRGQRLEFSSVPRGSEQAFSSNFFVDQNQDRKTDELRSSSQGAGNKLASPVRYYPIVGNGTTGGVVGQVDSLVRFEWEDQLKPPDGDFNDYR